MELRINDMDYICELCGDEGEVYQFDPTAPDNMYLVACECQIEGTDAYEHRIREEA